jgi:hypothetical protein
MTLYCFACRAGHCAVRGWVVLPTAALTNEMKIRAGGVHHLVSISRDHVAAGFLEASSAV